MTEWWAFKPITTAFEKTKKILIEPFNAWTWLKLMIIVFFVGSGGGRISDQFNNLGSYRTEPSDTTAIEQGVNSLLSNTTLILIILGALLLILCIALLLAYLRNVFSFVLIRALASGDVRILQPLMDNLGRGLRLFIFTILVGLLTLAVVIAFILAMLLFVFLIIKAGTTSALGIIVLLLGIFAIMLLLLAVIVFSIVMGIFVGFTYDFVAPMVYFKGMGIVESWKVLWASIKKDWQQYGVYVLTRWTLEFAVGILSLIILIPIVLIFFAVLIVGAFMAIAAASVSFVLALIIGLALLLALIAFIVATLVISMPIAVYFRYYSLDVLQQIDPSAVAYSERFSPPPATLPA